MSRLRRHARVSRAMAALCRSTILLGLLTACAVREPAAVNARVPQDTISLPLVVSESADPWRNAVAIWSHGEPPPEHEITLFRHEFPVPNGLEAAALRIFADTRYEAWLDGEWIGRGPARFSADRHEYDVLPIGDLAPGEHTLAVLVQWAPNARRSESTQPHLIAEIHGWLDDTPTVAASSDPTWRAVRSGAWRADAAQVHEWGILGPPNSWTCVRCRMAGCNPALTTALGLRPS